MTPDQAMATMAQRASPRMAKMKAVPLYLPPGIPLPGKIYRVLLWSYLRVSAPVCEWLSRADTPFTRLPLGRRVRTRHHGQMLLIPRPKWLRRPARGSTESDRRGRR